MSGNEQFVLYTELNNELTALKEAGEAPEWLTIEGLGTLKSGYLQKGETPKRMWERVAEAAASYYKVLDEDGSQYKYYRERFFELFWKGWLGGSSPVLANMGTDNGYPISCFASYVGDNRKSIFSSFEEISWLSSMGGGTSLHISDVENIFSASELLPEELNWVLSLGFKEGGVGVHISDVRARGTKIANGGISSGVVPWLKIIDSVTVGVNQCYKEGTQVLTQRGWVDFKDLNEEDLVMQANNDKTTSFVKPLRHFAYDHDGSLYHFFSEDKSVDLYVTDNHKMVLERRKRVTNKRLPCGRFFSHKKEDTGLLELVEAKDVNYHRDVYHYFTFPVNSESSLLSSKEQFLIAYQADGRAKPRSSGSLSGKYVYDFHFTKKRKIERLLDILKRCNYDYKHYQQKDGSTLIAVWLDFQPSKNFSWVDLSLVSEQWAKEFVEELGHWDGSFINKNGIQFSSTNKLCAEQAQAVATLAGYKSRITVDKKKEDHHSEVYQVNINPTTNRIGGENVFKEVVPYKGKVYCVEVNSGMLVVRYNDTVAVCGNSGFRRGALAAYLDINHPDFDDFIKMRQPHGDPNLQCLNIHHAVLVPDEFMERLQSGDEEAKRRWAKVLQTRRQTGEPYLFFIDTVNKNNPQWYKELGLSVKGSNLCLEGNQRVLTKKGALSINHLALLNYQGVATEVWDGNEWVEVKNFRYIGHTNQLVEVTYRDGSSIRTTLDHRTPLEDGTFVSAKDLKVGMKVLTHNVESHGSVELEGAYLKGFLAAEGTSHKESPILWLYSPKVVCKSRLIESGYQVATLPGKRSDCEVKLDFSPSGRNRERMSGLTARDENLISWCHDYKQSLPPEAFNWTRISKLEFIAGLFDGDGTVSTSSQARCYQIASIHKQFLLDLQELLKTLKVQSSVSLMRAAGESDFNDGYGAYQTAACYRLTISNKNAYILASICKFSRLPQLTPPGIKKPYNTKPTHGEIKQVRIVDVEPTATYCCTIPSTSMFALADGRMTGNCIEIAQHTDEDHTLVCCLASLNAANYDEWKNDPRVIQDSIYFLDAVIEEFIQKAGQQRGFGKAVASAVKARALGLGIMGYHTLLQQRGFPFASNDARLLNEELFERLGKDSRAASAELAFLLGEPEWCKGFGVRNTHTNCLAPTKSNSTICGNVSEGIEPIVANYFIKDTKGAFIQRNPVFAKLLQEKGYARDEVWSDILAHAGSVQHLPFLSEHEKAVFLTAHEIDQLEVVRQAASRQQFIDQSQSLNLFFPESATLAEINKVHFAAWKLGVKSLYYQKGEPKSRAGSVVDYEAIKPTVAEACPLVKPENEVCIPCQG